MSNPVDVYVADMLTRVVAIQKEVPTTPLANNAVPQAFYTQSDMPFWTNRIIGYRLVPGRSQDYFAYRYKLGMTYVRAFLTEGTNGEAEQKLYNDIPIISNWFAGTIELASVAFPTPMRYLDSEGVHMLDLTVFLGQMNSGIGAKIIGADFTLEVPITVPIQQRY